MNVVIVNLGDSRGMLDAILPLRCNLVRLGHDVSLTSTMPEGVEGLCVVFGAHRLCAEAIGRLPANFAVYNLEQISPVNTNIRGDYVPALRQRSLVWDYSRKNIANLKAGGVADPVYLPVLFAPELGRLHGEHPVGPSDGTDVLFYGVVNDRRARCLFNLERRGYRVRVLSGVYGAERDACIAGAKLVLNVHYYPEGILETTRLGYLWTNRVPVVSEVIVRGNAVQTEIPQGLEHACWYTPIDNVADVVGRMLSDPAIRRRIGDRGFEAFSKTPGEEMLRNALHDTMSRLHGERR